MRLKWPPALKTWTSPLSPCVAPAAVKWLNGYSPSFSVRCSSSSQGPRSSSSNNVAGGWDDDDCQYLEAQVVGGREVDDDGAFSAFCGKGSGEKSDDGASPSSMPSAGSGKGAGDDLGASKAHLASGVKEEIQMAKRKRLHNELFPIYNPGDV